MIQVVAVLVYLASIVAANFAAWYFGPIAVPLIGLVLIGLDLSLRDYLHDLWSGHLGVKMGLLIGAGNCPANRRTIGARPSNGSAGY